MKLKEDLALWSNHWVQRSLLTDDARLKPSLSGLWRPVADSGTAGECSILRCHMNRIIYARRSYRVAHCLLKQKHIFVMTGQTTTMCCCLRSTLFHLAGFAVLNTPRWPSRYCSTGIMAAQEPSPPSSLEGNKPGFSKKILANNLEDKHLCNSCQKILRRPLQAQCGHRFCSFCFNKTVRWVVSWLPSS